MEAAAASKSKRRSGSGGGSGGGRGADAASSSAAAAEDDDPPDLEREAETLAASYTLLGLEAREENAAPLADDAISARRDAALAESGSRSHTQKIHSAYAQVCAANGLQPAAAGAAAATVQPGSEHQEDAKAAWSACKRLMPTVSALAAAAQEVQDDGSIAGVGTLRLEELHEKVTATLARAEAVKKLADQAEGRAGVAKLAIDNLVRDGESGEDSTASALKSIKAFVRTYDFEIEKMTTTIDTTVRRLEHVRDRLEVALQSPSDEEAAKVRKVIQDATGQEQLALTVDTLLVHATITDRRRKAACAAFARQILGSLRVGTRPAGPAAAAAADADAAGAAGGGAAGSGAGAAADKWSSCAELTHEGVPLGHFVDELVVKLLKAPTFDTDIIGFADAKKHARGLSRGKLRPHDLDASYNNSVGNVVVAAGKPAELARFFLSKARLLLAAVWGEAREGEEALQALEHLHTAPCGQGRKCKLCTVHDTMASRWEALANGSDVPRNTFVLLKVADSRPPLLARRAPRCPSPPTPAHASLGPARTRSSAPRAVAATPPGSKR